MDHGWLRPEVHETAVPPKRRCVRERQRPGIAHQVPFPPSHSPSPSLLPGQGPGAQTGRAPTPQRQRERPPGHNDNDDHSSSVFGPSTSLTNCALSSGFISPSTWWHLALPRTALRISRLSFFCSDTSALRLGRLRSGGRACAHQHQPFIHLLSLIRPKRSPVATNHPRLLSNGAYQEENGVAGN